MTENRRACASGNDQRSRCGPRPRAGNAGSFGRITGLTAALRSASARRKKWKDQEEDRRLTAAAAVSTSRRCRRLRVLNEGKGYYVEYFGREESI